MKDIERLVQMNPALRYDPFIRQELNKERRRAETDAMHLMNQLPARSGWIVLLQNRVNLQSVGNLHYKTRVYYDATRRMVGATKETCDTPFRLARLKNGEPAAGWMEE